MLTIAVRDDVVYVTVNEVMVWKGTIGQWSFALANALVVNTPAAA